MEDSALSCGLTRTAAVGPLVHNPASRVRTLQSSLKVFRSGLSQIHFKKVRSKLFLGERGDSYSPGLAVAKTGSYCCTVLV